MTPHMSAQSIRTGVRLTLPAAIGPLARVPLLPAADVLVVDVLHQSIHVAQIAGATSVPPTDGDLVVVLAAVLLVLVVAEHGLQAGRVGDVARGIGGNRGGGRGWRWHLVLHG